MKRSDTVLRRHGGPRYPRLQGEIARAAQLATRRGALTYNVGMDETNHDTTLSDDDVRACVRVLRAIEADRSHLTRLTQEQRRELLTLAGLVAKPERHDLVKMAKAFRRAEREAAKERDRKVIEQTGLRIQRRAEVYAPLRLEPPKPEDLG